MTREEQSELLEYWLAGLRCGALTADGISAELDGIILTAGADLPNAILDAALAATKGETPLAAVLRESLLDLGVAGWMARPSRWISIGRCGGSFGHSGRAGRRPWSARLFGCPF